MFSWWSATCSCTDSQRDAPPLLEEVQSFPAGADGAIIAVSDADGMRIGRLSEGDQSSSSTQGHEIFQYASSVQPEELPPDDVPLLCVSLEPSPSSSRPSEIFEVEHLQYREESVQAPEEPLEEMSGWLMCYGEPSSGNRLQVTRLAKVSAGTPVAGFFWKKRYIELKDSQLMCWATKPQGPKKQAPSAILILSQLEEVAVEGKTLSLHLRNSKLALQARAETEELCNKWAAAVKSHAARAISKSLPPGWDVEAMLSSGVGGSAAKLVNKELLPPSCQPVFQKLLDHCFVCKTTKDRRGNTVPLRLEIVDAVRVQNGAAWIEYSKARNRICEKVFENNQWLKQSLDSESCSSFTNSEGRQISRTDAASHGSDSASLQWDPFGMQTPLLTGTLDLRALQQILGKTDPSSNEQWLFHGTSRAAVENISDREFRLDKAGSHRGTLYGKGIYFAECVTKADEYCVEDADGYCWMLLCRVALGKVMVCKEKKPSPDILEQCIAGSYDSLIGDRWTAVGTFREFILFDSDQVYPAFILRYKRWSEAAFCRCIRETAESEDAEMAAELYPHAAILAEEHPDSTVRYRLSLLMDAHSDSVVPFLCDALKDRRRRVRLNATKALMNMAGQTSSVEALPDGSRYRRHRDGVHVVITAVPALTTCLKDADRFVRRAAARALERLGEHAKPAVPSLIMSLRDREEEVRAAVATALGQLGPAATEALPALLQASLDNEESVRVAALGALGSLGLTSTAVLEVLTDALQDMSSEVKSAAAVALGMLSAVPAVDALADCLSDGQSHVRAAAARALGQIGGKHTASAVPRLIQSLKDSDHAVRRSAAVSLGRIGIFAASAANHLADAMRDTNSQVREAAATSICRLGVTERIPHNVCIQSLVKRGLTDSCAEVRQAAAESLLELIRSDQLGSHRAMVREAMAVRMKDENAKVRGIASTSLGLIQDEGSKKKKKAKKNRDSGRDPSPDMDMDEDDLDPEGVLELEDIARLVLSLTRRVRDVSHES